MRRSVRSALFGAAAGVALIGGSAAASAQSPLDGGYFGLQGDYSDFHGANGFGAGIFGGFGRVFDQGTYLGIEANLGRSDASGSGTYDGARVNMDVRENYGISFRPGFVVAPNTLLYGRIGWERTKFRGRGPAVASRSRCVDGARFGAGAEVSMASNLFLRTEYSFTWNRDLKLTHVSGREITPDNNRHAIRIGAGLRF
jgi:outer membrane immunogenic protein